jgi:hypothetical protein
MGSYVISDKSRYPVAANAVITARDQISINATGYAVPAPAPSPGVTGTVMGSAIAAVNNTGGADGAVFVTVEHSRGERAFLFAAGALTIADVGKAVYVGANAKAVSTTSTNAVRSGTLLGIEDDGRARVLFPI